MTDPVVDSAVQGAFNNTLLPATPQRGTYTDKNTGAVWAWEVVDGKLNKVQVQDGTMGPAYEPDLQLIQTDKGQVVVDKKAYPAGTPIPGTAPKIAAPATQDVNGNVYEQQPDDSWKLTIDKTKTPGYQPPRDPVADAIASRVPVKTSEQLGSDAKAIAIAQGEALEAQWQRDHVNGKVSTPAEEAALKSKYEMITAEYTASVNRLAAETKSKETADTATTLWDRQAQGRADATALANAGETRAQGAEARAAQQARFTQTQAQAGVYTAQAEQGQGIVDQATKLGVRISGDEYKALYFDPHARALALLGQAMQGTDFDPHARALGLIGQQMQPAQAVPAAPSAVPPAQVPPPAPQIYDSSPQGSSIGGQAPNVPTPLWQQGPAATGMANDQTSLWGQDKPTQSLFLGTYNNDPILASQMWAKQHNAPPQAPTVGPPRAPTLN